MTRVGWRRSARYWLPAVWPLALGVVWIVMGARSNTAALILAIGAGIGPLASGAAALFWGLDRMIVYHMALAGGLGALAGLLGMMFWSPYVAAALFLAASGTYWISGWGGLLLWQSRIDDDDDDVSLLGLAHHAALDCALMGFYVHCARMPDHSGLNCQIEELRQLETRRGGMIHAVSDEPTQPVSVDLRALRVRHCEIEWLTFASGYAPDVDVPGAERWHSYEANRTVACRLLRHQDRPRPWLICIHGYRMGSALDLSAFQAERLHRQWGINICMPLLPLHGIRRATRLTGGLYLDGPMPNVWHAVSQSVADIRQAIAWLRATQSPVGVGVFGLSLGGYIAALLASFERELSPVIAGIPMVAIAPTLWQHMPEASRVRLAQAGFDAGRLDRLLTQLSPLHQPRPATRQRAIIAARADQVVPPDQPTTLWHHWQQPPIFWANAGHLSIQRRPDARSFVDRFVGTMHT